MKALTATAAASAEAGLEHAECAARSLIHLLRDL